MQNALLLLMALITGWMISSNQDPEQKEYTHLENKYPECILGGKWVRLGPTGPISLNFKPDGLVEGDFGDDTTIDIMAEYTIKNDTISFMDKKGPACPNAGLYKIYTSDYYISFDLIEDDCAGRVKATMGFWVRPDFEDLIKDLSDKMATSENPELYLSRARIYMAVRRTTQARQDFDRYIKHDTTNARVYVNRAGTRFPNDLHGAVYDCNKALELEPENRNGYFLRGLALYGLGEKEEACADFYKAIELGFIVLRDAEKERCVEFWKSYE
jgi:hypothetical protein